MADPLRCSSAVQFCNSAAAVAVAAAVVAAAAVAAAAADGRARRRAGGPKWTALRAELRGQLATRPLPRTLGSRELQRGISDASDAPA